MKSKCMLIFFTLVFLGSAAFAATDANKKSVTKTKRTLGGLNARTNALEEQVRLLQSQIKQMQNQESVEINKPNNKYFSTLAEMYAHGPAIVASPLFGLRANDEEVRAELMVGLPRVNRDLFMLKLRKKTDDYAAANNIHITRSPLIILSGGAEGRLIYKANDNYTKTARTDINLNRVELDAVGEIGPWITASMIIAYDDKAGNNYYDSNVTRVNNSRLQIDRAWLTIGQLNKAPVYFSIGQLHAPFGNYARFGVTTTSTQHLGRMKDRMVILGYDYGDFNAQVYGFAGEAQSSSNESQLTKITKHSGADFGYKYDGNNFKARIGAGIIGNLAESEGMQDKIFGKSTDSKTGNGETLNSRVFGYNGYAKLDIYNFALLGEYVAAANSFDPADITFNGHGARPQALQVEGAYSFKIKDKPNTIFAGYGLTSQALALDLPKQSFTAGYSVSLIKNTLASIEYRHDVNYGWGDMATSKGNGRDITANVTNGKHRNIVTLQVGAYF